MRTLPSEQEVAVAPAKACSIRVSVPAFSAARKRLTRIPPVSSCCNAEPAFAARSAAMTSGFDENGA